MSIFQGELRKNLQDFLNEINATIEHFDPQGWLTGKDITLFKRIEEKDIETMHLLKKAQKKSIAMGSSGDATRRKILDATWTARRSIETVLKTKTLERREEEERLLRDILKMLEHLLVEEIALLADDNLEQVYKTHVDNAELKWNYGHFKLNGGHTHRSVKDFCKKLGLKYSRIKTERRVGSNGVIRYVFPETHRNKQTNSDDPLYNRIKTVFPSDDKKEIISWAREALQNIQKKYVDYEKEFNSREAWVGRTKNFEILFEIGKVSGVVQPVIITFYPLFQE